MKARTGLARSTIYEMIREGTFPAQVRLGIRAVGWRASDVENWIAERVAAARPSKTAA
ncbi:MAG: AlpA family phage regulatory protein [Polyangia bacterium]